MLLPHPLKIQLLNHHYSIPENALGKMEEPHQVCEELDLKPVELVELTVPEKIHLEILTG